MARRTFEEEEPERSLPLAPSGSSFLPLGCCQGLSGPWPVLLRSRCLLCHLLFVAHPPRRDRGRARLQQQGRGPTRGAGRAEPGPGAPGVACPPVSGLAWPQPLPSAQRHGSLWVLSACCPTGACSARGPAFSKSWHLGPGQRLRGASPGATPVSCTPLPADGLAPPEAWGPGSAQPDGEGPDLWVPPQGPDRVLRPSTWGSVAFVGRHGALTPAWVLAKEPSGRPAWRGKLEPAQRVGERLLLLTHRHSAGQGRPARISASRKHFPNSFQTPQPRAWMRLKAPGRGWGQWGGCGHCLHGWWRSALGGPLPTPPCPSPPAWPPGWRPRACRSPLVLQGHAAGAHPIPHIVPGPEDLTVALSWVGRCCWSPELCPAHCTDKGSWDSAWALQGAWTPRLCSALVSPCPGELWE